MNNSYRVKSTFVFFSLLSITMFTGAQKAMSGQTRTRPHAKLAYPVVDTGQGQCYDYRRPVPFPGPGQPFYGQDAQWRGLAMAYRDNGDGTVTDLNTGLVWQKAPDFVMRTWADAGKYAAALTLAGHRDWRLPHIKELFSIVDFHGNQRTRTPYLNTRFFDFMFPKVGPGVRSMDAQYWSSNQYAGMTMFGDRSAFGFNFADGRLKSYPIGGNHWPVKKFARCVRGPAYGQNHFADNQDGTITDQATGLVWMKSDSGKPMDWGAALKYAEELEFAGHKDWRLPNVKELQSIVDYSRAPDAREPARRGPAISPIFKLTRVESWFWTSTTHLENRFGYYVCFGQAFSARKRRGRQVNAHGAGAVRSDPKAGDPRRWPNGLGPQADEIRIYNYVRCVRGGNVLH